MPEPRRSRRFHPNVITEIVVPVILVFLLLILLAVLVMVASSLAG